VTAAGQVYVCGFTNGALPNAVHLGLNDAYAMRLDATTGLSNWTWQFGTVGTDLAGGCGADAAGNVAVGGMTTGRLPGELPSGGLSDGFIVRTTP
jgi:hypothetical protein